MSPKPTVTSLAKTKNTVSITKRKYMIKMTVMGLSTLANTISIVNRYEWIQGDIHLRKVRKKRSTKNSNSNFCTPDFDVINTVYLMDISIEEVK